MDFFVGVVGVEDDAEAFAAERDGWGEDGTDVEGLGLEGGGGGFDFCIAGDEDGDDGAGGGGDGNGKKAFQEAAAGGEQFSFGLHGGQQFQGSDDGSGLLGGHGCGENKGAGTVDEETAEVGGSYYGGACAANCFAEGVNSRQ